jgi:glycine oxidase
MLTSRTSPGHDVIIIGGGAVGCATAWTLAREGLRVLLLERNDLASEASGAAAGMLAPLAEADSPGPFLRFGLESLRIYPDLCQELWDRSGIDPEYVRSGILRVARDEAEAETLRSKADRLTSDFTASPSGTGNDRGDPDAVALEWLDAGQARDVEPKLGPALAGALWSPAEAQVRSPLLTRAYAGAAQSLGAQIELGVEVQGVLLDGERVVGVRSAQGEWRAGAVVLCAGCWSGVWLQALRAAGGRLGRTPALSIEPERGQIAALEPRRPGLRSIVWAGSTYLVPKRDGSLVIGATQERVGFDKRVTSGGVEGLLAEAHRMIPALEASGFRWAWAGLRPMSADGLPSIGALPGLESLYVAAGHHRNGVLLSAITARLVRDAVMGKSLPEDAAAFDPARWV